MRRFRSFNYSTCKTVLNLLEAVYLRLKKIVVERVTVVKFRVDNTGSNGTGCFRINVRTDTAQLTNMRMWRSLVVGSVTIDIVGRSLPCPSPYPVSMPRPSQGLTLPDYNWVRWGCASDHQNVCGCVAAHSCHGSGSASWYDLRAGCGGGCNNKFICLGPLDCDKVGELLWGLLCGLEDRLPTGVL